MTGRQPVKAFMALVVWGTVLGCGGASMQLQPEQMLGQIEGQQKRQEVQQRLLAQAEWVTQVHRRKGHG